MLLLFALLLVVCSVILIIGLIKPSAVLFGFANKTRGKVILVYGLAMVFCFIMLGVLTPDSPESEKLKTKVFYGQVIFETTIVGDNQSAKSLAEMGLPSKTIIEMGNNCLQCTEIGGLTDGTFLTDSVKNRAWFLDYETRTATKATYNDLDENATDLLKQMYPYTYGTELEVTNDTLTICGFKTQKYKVVHSSFIRDYATANIWITKEMKFPLHRYDFQTDSKRMVSPLPLSIINDIGAILKVEISETGVLITYTATFIKSKDYQNFSIPEDFNIVEN